MSAPRKIVIALFLFTIYLPDIILGATLPNRVIVTGILEKSIIIAAKYRKIIILCQYVLIGAAGRTGSLVLKKLLEKPALFSSFGIVRTEKSAKKLQKQLKSTSSEVCMTSQETINFSSYT